MRLFIVLVLMFSVSLMATNSYSAPLWDCAESPSEEIKESQQEDLFSGSNGGSFFPPCVALLDFASHFTYEAPSLQIPVRPPKVSLNKS